jgi:hypothetical protein
MRTKDYYLHDGRGTVHYWYDRAMRLWIIQRRGPVAAGNLYGDQIGSAWYAPSRVQAVSDARTMLECWVNP